MVAQSQEWERFLLEVCSSCSFSLLSNRSVETRDRVEFVHSVPKSWIINVGRMEGSYRLRAM